MQVNNPPDVSNGGTGGFAPDRLYLGDSLSLMRDLPDGNVDLVITDPPFAIDFRATRNNYHRTGSRVMEGYREIAPEDYLSFTMEWMGQAFRVLRPTGSLYVFSG
jgi:site-specific DNA-methyltransferase (adenine-specific)